jgi:formylglycine-generating enzyme required for sulfatase activity/serine/threonine protein kinase
MTSPNSKRFAKYNLLRQVGRGAMAEVWLAEDTVLKRPVALKLLSPSAILPEHALERFVREAQAMALLSSPHIVSIFDMGTHDERVFIAMEFIEGRSLAEEVREDGPGDWLAATRSIRDAALGLRAAHQEHVIHRDVKPSNLMRSKDGQVRVVDFGLARLETETSTISQPGTILGTPPYMSPEQCLGKETDERSDLYSLVCTYYALVVGKAPFMPNRSEVVMMKHIHGRFPDPSAFVQDIPASVCQVIAKGTRKRRESRYQNADELIEQLERILDGTLDFGEDTSGQLPELVIGSGVDDSKHVGETTTGGLRASAPPASSWTWSQFAVVIQRRTEDGYPVLVDAPEAFGEPEGLMQIDLNSGPLRESLDRLEQDTFSLRELKKFGSELFTGLLKGHQATAFELSLNSHLAVAERRGLRVTLQVLPDELQHLPWEILFHAVRNSVFSVESGTPVSRFVAGPAPRIATNAGPLRILLCVSQPKGLPPTEATEEIRSVEAALQELVGADALNLKVMRRADGASLHRALAEFEPHVFHFIGHGDQRGRLPGLFLENGDAEQFLDEDSLSEMLLRPRTVCFAVLNACRSYKLAYALARHGIPSAGMLTEISNQAAVAFSRGMYKALVQRLPLDQAVNQGRDAVRVSYGSERRDWFAPVVVLPRGVAEVFTTPTTSPPDKQARQTVPFRDEPPKRHPRKTAGTSWLALTTGTPLLILALVSANAAGWFDSASPDPSGVERHAQAPGIEDETIVEPTDNPATSIDVAPKPDLRLRAALLPAHEMITLPAGQLRQGFWDESNTVSLVRSLKQRLEAQGTEPDAVRSSLKRAFEALGAEPRTVALAAFDIDKNEVTNGEYREFLLSISGSSVPLDGASQDHSRCHPDEKPDKTHAPLTWRPDDYPVTGVDWFDAYTYARWKGKRLPSEDEYELAARGQDGSLYPWGTEFDADLYWPLGIHELCSVGEYRNSRADAPTAMAGNAAEWTSSASALLQGSADEMRMKIKGGGFAQGEEASVFAVGFARHLEQRTYYDEGIGFRCARFANGPTLDGMVRISEQEAHLGGESSPGLEFVRLISSQSQSQLAVELVGVVPSVREVAAFRMDIHEVRNAHYRRFLDYLETTDDSSFCHPEEPTHRHTPEYWNDPQFPAEDQPVVGVNWYDAFAYASWVGKRLPTAEEWWRAARGNSTRMYPWGDQFESAKCNSRESSALSAAPVTSFESGASPFGMLQMAGNAAEWTGENLGESVQPGPFLLGGGWDEQCIATASLGHILFERDRDYRDKSSGFRCAEDL